MTDTPGWSIRSARTVYDNPWISVRHYEAVAPTGSPATYGLVHMKNLALGVLPIDADGCTLLVGQQRFPFGRYSWELPEGGGPHDRPPLESAQRELAEETGLVAASWRPLFSNIHLSNSVTDERASAWLAWDLSRAQAAGPDPSEALALRRAPFPEAVRMAVNGEITDAFSLVMLLMADHLAKSGALPEPLARLMLTGA
jgi:8-oxo-dGTP pyrophosphatase MutT (NUDIX family)